MEFIIKLLFISFISINIYYCDNSYCKKICQNIRNCVKLCENYSKDPKRSSVDLPHCGLTDFSGNDRNDYNKRIIDDSDAENHKYPRMVSIKATFKFILNSNYTKDTPVERSSIQHLF